MNMKPGPYNLLRTKGKLSGIPHYGPVRKKKELFLEGLELAFKTMKPPYGGFRSETATWIQKWFKISIGTSRKLWI
jgi:hypothetical protein